MKFFKKFILIGAVILYYSDVLYAKAYKCTISDEVSYQSEPCKTTEKNEEIDINVKKITIEEACLSTCKSENLICISTLKYATYNNDGGIDVCKLKSEWCEAVCNKSDNIVDKKYSYFSAKNNYNYKIKIHEINKNKKIREKKRIYNWNEARKKEINECITEGMIEIDSLKSRFIASEREDKLKIDCKQKARSTTYGEF